MNLHPSAETLALYTGDDLAAEDVSPIKAHLQSCDDCRSKVSELAGIRTQWHRLPEPADGDLALVRSAVLSQVGQPRHRPWKWVAPLAIATALALVIFLTRPPLAPPIDSSLSLTTPLATVKYDLVLPQAFLRNVKQKPKRLPTDVQDVLRTASLVRASDGQSQLRLTTSDPNIIFLVPLEDSHEN